ncbi:unnamed protein product [Moneuplotes crassus]|uniref:Uncharacterized protein n=1 Tax=Euplotes crassus TaxID=5936 RepID=A0AAD1UJ70_EUPCR|nr:unnamed protein product [Moneuplotes crassus]
MRQNPHMMSRNRHPPMYAEPLRSQSVDGFFLPPRPIISNLPPMSQNIQNFHPNMTSRNNTMSEEMQKQFEKQRIDHKEINNSSNYSLYSQKLSQYKNVVLPGSSQKRDNSQNKCMNFNENKYKIQPGPNAQAKIRKILNRRCKPDSECNESPLVPPQPAPMAMSIQKLQEQIEDLNVIRDENNKELIKLETDLTAQTERAEKAEKERDELIAALNDLTEKCKQVEVTCDRLEADNIKLTDQLEALSQESYQNNSLEEKIKTQNTMISQLKEEVSNKDQWGNELLEKYEKSLNEISIFKKTMKALDKEKESQKQDYQEIMSKVKHKYEKKINELNSSIKILTRTMTQFENAQKEKFDSIYNKCQKTLEQDFDLSMSHSFDHGAVYNKKPPIGESFQELSDKDILENDTLFISPSEPSNENERIQRLIKQEKEKNRLLMQELSCFDE